MKNYLLTVLFAVTAQVLSAQNQNGVKFQGGLWLSTNKQTTFLGFIGPKFSYTTNLTKKTKIEIGLNGVPGLVIRPEVKLGLSVGSTLTFKTQNKNFKPIIGVMFIKNKAWEPMLGIGFLF